MRDTSTPLDVRRTLMSNQLDRLRYGLGAVPDQAENPFDRHRPDGAHAK